VLLIQLGATCVSPATFVIDQIAGFIQTSGDRSFANEIRRRRVETLVKVKDKAQE
jgi:hypothetical protein